MYYLNEAQKQSLIHQPETGMGYQLVELTTRENRRVVGVAYNAEVVLEKGEPGARALFERFTVRGTGVKETGFEHGSAVRDIRILPRDSVEFRTLIVGEARADYGIKRGPAKDASIEATKPGEVFKRFSISEQDCRVRADGSLEPGSFATTEEDARQVRTGKDAGSRYALPEQALPYVYVYTIKPVPATSLQRGEVQPANGQPGGGAEVIFTLGTTPRTVTGPAKIPAE